MDAVERATATPVTVHDGVFSTVACERIRKYADRAHRAESMMHAMVYPRCSIEPD